MIIKRIITPKLVSLSQQFPAIAILGPRQSGKTTLAQQTFPDYEYFSFEDPDIRDLVRQDYRGFLNKYTDSKGIILDEIQHVPDLLSYMQTHIDKHKKIGHFIITGSHNLLLNERISQSLAGRIAILTLLPLSIAELQQANQLNASIDDTLFKGFYPSLYNSPAQPLDFYKSYINTYIERDVRQIKNIMDLTIFQNFMRLCAGRVGQILNYSSLSNDLGMSIHGVKQWLSILEASYIIFLLKPYYRNFGKRLVHAPKLYFFDQGVACSLLSINNTDQLFSHYARGNLFESMIIADFYKQRFNFGLNPNSFYWRDKSDYEVDCIIEHANSLRPVEIKASQVYNKNALEQLGKWNVVTQTKQEDNILIYGGDLDQPTSQGQLLGWKSIGNLANQE